jgi:hypothetical protein
VAYSDFSLEAIVEQQGLKLLDKVSLFSQITPLSPSAWLQETLSVTATLGLFSGTEKARSEFIVVPILVEVERRNLNQFTIFSGKSLDIDRAKGLNGECDFILSKGPPSRLIQAPIVPLVEAKKQDIDLGLGQCVAQMVGAQLFNQRKQQPINQIYGCVTTGDRWQFLQLQAQTLSIDQHEYALSSQLSDILGIFQTILEQS